MFAESERGAARRHLGVAARRGVLAAARWARSGWRSVRGRIPMRRVVRWALVVLALAVPSLAWGVATASTESGLGPHSARYEVTLDHEITVDLGPLGTVVIDSPLPVTLGARVVVQEIPREVTAVSSAATLEALSQDLEQYIQFFSGPQATITEVVRGLVHDAVRRALWATVLATGIVVGGRALLGARRRAELAAAARPHRASIAAGSVVGLLVVSVLNASVPTHDDPTSERVASAVFDGTPLEGARITGRLAGVIDTYGGQVVDAYRDNERFYADATGAVRAAWAQQEAVEAEIERLRAMTDLRLALHEPDGAPEPVVMVVVSDLHCNVGMAPVIGAVAELSGADILLNAGDTTANGTAVEAFCVTALADALPDGVVQVVADGNHDSEETAAQERRVGARVLEGDVIEVAGVRILGDADPRATRIGVGTTLLAEETVDDVGRRLADVACAAPDGVDLLLVHDPGVGDAALNEGCVPAQVSGHYHRRIGPLRYGEGVRFTSGSTAGALLGQATVGPLSGPAEITVLRFDPESRRFLDHRVVRVRTDATATVGSAVEWPSEPPIPSRRTAFR